MNKDIASLIDKSKRSLNAARLLSESGDYDFAVARAYYAIFYFSETLLLTKQLSFSKHVSVISAIFKYCIKTGELNKSFHKVLHRAFDLRQTGDYFAANLITKDVVDEIIAGITAEIKKAGKLI